MLALFRSPTRQQQDVVDKKEVIIEAAKKVGVLSGMMTALNDNGPDSRWLTGFEEVNKEVNDKIQYVEHLCLTNKEKGDIHVLRVIKEIRLTQSRYLEYVDNIIKS